MRMGASFAAALTGIVWLACVSCSRESDSGAGPSGAPSASAAMPAGSASAPASPPATPPAPTTITWKGTYSSAPGSMYVYDGGEWKGVHFRGDDASVALGDGPLTLTLDPKTHLVRGEASGPIGDAIVTGALTKDEVTFSVLRKDTTDRGLTGTGVGTVAGATLTGTMRLSRGDAHIIREARFTLTKSAP